jgi:hypothetical protein
VEGEREVEDVRRDRCRREAVERKRQSGRREE